MTLEKLAEKLHYYGMIKFAELICKNQKPKWDKRPYNAEVTFVYKKHKNNH